jgi:DNA (cytosine-5)-methyltransferase 1
MRIGSLFSGAGGLDLAVEAVFGGQTLWHSEIDPSGAAALEHHWPAAINLGDISAVNWANVPDVDVICGGFPCQDVSVAGRRLGLAGARSGLWFRMRAAIEALRPQVAVIENVLGLVSSGAIDQVVAELAALGYAPRWAVNSAASVGAPHRRRRVFVVATQGYGKPRRVEADDSGPRGVKLFPTPEAKNSHAGQDYARADRPNSGGDDLVTAVVKGYDSRWAQYAAAVGRWENLTRPAPHPTEPSSTGAPKLNAEFAEWLMGWPAGWVSAVPSSQDALFGDPAGAIGRSDQLKLCGNGVVPQQAEAAIRLLINEKAVAV